RDPLVTGVQTCALPIFARIIGETAPLLIVTGASTFFNHNPLHNPMNSLPLFIFAAVRSGEPLFIQRAYGAAAVLLALVLVLFSRSEEHTSELQSRVDLV